jgi:hypothetical protein
MAPCLLSNSDLTQLILHFPTEELALLNSSLAIAATKGIGINRISRDDQDDDGDNSAHRNFDVWRLLA